MIRTMAPPCQLSEGLGSIPGGIIYWYKQREACNHANKLNGAKSSQNANRVSSPECIITWTKGEEQFGQLRHEPYSSSDICFSFPSRKLGSAEG